MIKSQVRLGQNFTNRQISILPIITICDLKSDKNRTECYQLSYQNMNKFDKM